MTTTLRTTYFGGKIEGSPRTLSKGDTVTLAWGDKHTGIGKRELMVDDPDKHVIVWKYPNGSVGGKKLEEFQYRSKTFNVEVGKVSQILFRKRQWVEYQTANRY